MNSVCLVGNLGQEPEMRYTPNGKAVTNFSIAINFREETEWVNIEAWGKTAELCNQYLHKGSQVAVQGRLKTDKWESDGQTKYKTKVVAEKVQFIGKKGVPDGDD